MAGIYIHIPFCEQACHYCDFHFSTNFSLKDEVLSCLILELQGERNYLQNDLVESIYFGGGTPSALPYDDLSTLIETITQNYEVAGDAEITLEANPENITRSNLTGYTDAGINRLSLGVQSFDKSHLKFLNRIHTAEQAINSLELIGKSNISNFNLDLIFGIDDNTSKWMQNLHQGLCYNPPHISAYNLTIEERTVFGNWKKRGKLTEVSDDEAACQFEETHYVLTSSGYIHYEISNYCKEGFFSKHNSSYWDDSKYLGIGPSAHSYNGHQRRMNVRNNAKYVKAVNSKNHQYEIEQLSIEDRINDYLLTSLRTIWGCDVNYLKVELGYDVLHQKANLISGFEKKGMLKLENNHLILELKGQLLADNICEALMIE